MPAAMAPQSAIDPPRYDVARCARRRENAERLHVFVAGGMEASPGEGGDARTAGEMRATLEAARTPIGGLITSPALPASATPARSQCCGVHRGCRGLPW